MKKGYTEIIFIWDKSGSMNAVYDDALGGFNSFIKDQQLDNDDTRLTLVQFDGSIDEVFTSKPVKEIHEFTRSDYRLGGSTALLDAIGITMTKVELRFFDMIEDQRPENVIMVIQTDGYENSSREFSNRQITEMIKRKEEVDKWEIIYLGANLDAFDSRNDIGLRREKMMNYENASTTDAFMATSMSIKDMKSGRRVESMETYLRRRGRN